MSISTKAELKTAAANWLDDTSLTSRLDEFVTLGESRINRDFGSIRMAWTDEDLTGTPDSRELTLPTDFVEARALFLTTFDIQTMLAPFVAGTFELDTTSGTPGGWCINGANIDLDRPCDSAHTFSFRYRARWQLDADGDTSWLLENHPDVYLAAVLIEAFVYRQDSVNAVAWETRYRMAKDEIEENEARALAVAKLRVDPALTAMRGRGTFNWQNG